MVPTDYIMDCDTIFEMGFLLVNYDIQRRIIMKRLRWSIFIYSVLFVVVLLLALNDYSPILIVGVTVVAGFIAFITQFYYPAALEKRVDRVESFLRSQKNKPAVYIHYILANRLEDESRTIMEQLMSKYKRVRYRQRTRQLMDCTAKIWMPFRRQCRISAILITGHTTKRFCCSRTGKVFWLGNILSQSGSNG
ncbi:hypothetical protein PBOR_08295 [Paenibacillus borealis]|uniref:Uncharacterized protein n=1 Tax=Paenibacillus borealis TaxID=160799 RepID=A0A089LCU1_PAEBO|nr:hypothetical protein PBOR_08295 [Paenibacillus borealis]